MQLILYQILLLLAEVSCLGCEDIQLYNTRLRCIELVVTNIKFEKTFL